MAKEREFLDVDPRTLRLPTTRRSGANPVKLQRQLIRSGTSVAGMPPLLVSRGTDGELVISDGVTQATRVAKLLPGVPVRVEVVGDLPIVVGPYPRVGDTLP